MITVARPDSAYSYRVGTFRATWTLERFLGLAAVHVVLALMMVRWPVVSTLHAWGIFAAGLGLAATARSLVTVACFGSYVAGAELLWRMTGAHAFWEMGKYVVIATLLVAAGRRAPLRRTSFPWIFVLLLAPSCIFTILDMPFETARQQLSFNLSGPLAMGVCAAFFSRLRLSRSDLKAIFFSFLVPVMGIWAIVVGGIVTATDLQFTSESNASLSGGYGPNQVSSILGFGALAAFLLSVFLGWGDRSSISIWNRTSGSQPFQPTRRKRTAKSSKSLRIGMFVLALLLGMQSALTFSRSGLYLAIMSLGAASLVGIRHASTRRLIVASSIMVYLVARFVIFPQIEAFTHGTLSQRFRDAGLTGRDRLMQADLAIWAAHPVFGVGPGMAVPLREALYRGASAHSELTRALAEHGILGLLAILYLLIHLSHNVLCIRSAQTQFVVASLAAFGMLFMATNAMRIVLCSYVVGIAFAVFVDEISRHSARRQFFIRHRPRLAQPV